MSDSSTCAIIRRKIHGSGTALGFSRSGFYFSIVEVEDRHCIHELKGLSVG